MIHSVHFPGDSIQNGQFADEGKTPFLPHTIPIKGGRFLNPKISLLVNLYFASPISFVTYRSLFLSF